MRTNVGGKMKDIHVLCGGQSTEHEISLRSAWQIINQLDKEKYNVSMTFITKDGRFVPLGHFKEKIESPEALMREAFLSKQESIMQFIDFINTLNDSGIPGSGMLSPFTIDS